MSDLPRWDVDLLPWFAEVVASAEGAILSKTLDGVIVTWNRAAERLYGYSAEEAVGKHVSILLPADGRDETDALLERLARGERIERHETTRHRKDGSLVEVSLALSPVRDATGQVIGAVTIAHDIGDRERAWEAAHRARTLEAVGRVAAGVAHDFNNFLTGIYGSGLFALAHLPAGEAREAIEDIVQIADRARDLTRQLLGFSTRPRRSSSVVQPNDVIRELTPLLRRLVGNEVELTVALAADVPLVSLDRSELEQIVVNLAANARDAMPNGGKLTIETHRAELPLATERVDGGRQSVPHAVLVVTDTGVGVAEEARSRLFEPFFTTKRPGTGTGIGLATTHAIVERAGGLVSFESELGRGTVFEISLPSA